MRIRVVRVDWLDAHGGIKQGWRPFDSANRIKPVHAVSFGMLLRSDEKYVVVAGHGCGDQRGLSADSLDIDAEIAIPRAWVRKVTNLGWLE